MLKDKFSAVWVSHSSINDYLKCPRAYFLRNVYKDPKTGHKITRMQPPLALGQAVHEVIESLSLLPTDERLKTPLTQKLEPAWSKIAGKKGGFKSPMEEKEYKDRAVQMLEMIEQNPGPILSKAVKLRTDNGLPYFWLSEPDNIILCGKIDWLEYIEDNDSLHIIDFKTGKSDEDGDSLQLPIYYLLVNNLQKRNVSKASYWYLTRENQPRQVDPPDLGKAGSDILQIAKKIAAARKLDHFKCHKTTGCPHCLPLEAIIRGEAEFVGESEYKQDIYFLP